MPSLPVSTEERATKKERSAPQNGLRYFINWDPEAQLETFFAWLPQELHTLPGMNWKQLSPRIMGYCVRSIGNDPDARALAVIAASLHGAVSLATQRTQLSGIYVLLRGLRATAHLQSLDDLKQEQIWYEWAAQQKKTSGFARQSLNAYASFVEGHFPRYLQRLDGDDREDMRRYALPPFPPNLRENSFPSQQLKVAQTVKRKAQTDILTPLYPLLRQEVRFRKQAAERMLRAFREARNLAETGKVELPYHFQYAETIPEINRDARTVAEARIQAREVLLKFILWDKRTWVEHHRSRYSDVVIRYAASGKRLYQERNCFFLQFDGPAADLLWFGDLVEHRLCQRFDYKDSHPDDYQERWQVALRYGFPNGCCTAHTGLLSTGDHWFARTAERGTELIIEPESLYRGILMGAALAMIALSNGSRINELLQVSWNKERRITRTETVAALGEDGQPQRGEDGYVMTRQVQLHFQHLLPKGAKTDEERQLFPLSREALRLLGEIKALLEETYGTIPVVAPSHSNTKHEHLKPERYLFQWDASPDEKLGALCNGDVQTLLRFILHGLNLSTAHGTPIRVSVHVLRHVMATHARHYRNVPPEAIAYFFLHHRLKELTGKDTVLSAATDYYTLMTEEQRMALIRADLDEQEELDHALLQAAPTARDLTQKNELIRESFDIWHALHPTALGNCGCPGLCPRGNDRSLCLGCSYHVENPEKLGAALSWRISYAKQAELFEAQGSFIDARQARIKVQLLDDMLNVMRMQIEEEAAGRYIPVFKVLPSPHRKTEAGDEDEG